MKRHKTEYKGVYFREAERIGGKGTEKVFYIVFKKNGKVFEEKVGRQYADNVTAAKAGRVRAERIEGRCKSRKRFFILSLKRTARYLKKRLAVNMPIT
jgi:hypothetical protein